MLSYMHNLTTDECRTVLCQRIRALSARPGKVHTRIIGWGMAPLEDYSQAQAQAQALVCKVHFPLIHCLIFKLTGQCFCGTQSKPLSSSDPLDLIPRALSLVVLADMQKVRLGGEWNL